MISIESADIYHDNLNRKNYIYGVLKKRSTETTNYYNEKTFLFKIIINHDTNIFTMDILTELKFENTFDVKYSQVVCNAYKPEFFIINSSIKKTAIIYYSMTEEEIKSTKYFDFEFKGLNIHSSPDNFFLEILSTSGIFKVFYEDKDIHYNDFSYHFIKCLEILYNENNESFKIKPNQLTKEESSNSEANLKKIIESYLNKIGELIDQENEFEFEKTQFYNSLKNFELGKISYNLEEIILQTIDDESLNIDSINLNPEKSELVIREYLKRKKYKIEHLLFILKKSEFFNYFDPNKAVFFYIVESLEKIQTALYIRELENKLIERNTIISNNIAFTDQEKKQISFKLNFFKLVYENYRKNILKKEYKNFSKFLVYSKISRINDLISTIFITYLQSINDYKTDKIEKANYTFLIVELFSSIISGINESFIQHEIKDEPVEKYRENSNYMWFTKTEYLSYLRTVHKNILDTFPLIQSLSLVSDLNESLFDYTDKILWLHERFYSVNSSDENKKRYFKEKKDILSRLTSVDSDKTLSLTIKYNDYFNMTLICYEKGRPQILNEIMKNSSEFVIQFILKLYLKLESEAYRQGKSLEVNFFEVFVNFSNQISMIVSAYPKLKLIHENYLKSIGKMHIVDPVVSIEEVCKKVKNENNIEKFLKIAKINNSLDRLELDEKLQNDINNILYKSETHNNNKNCIKIHFLLLLYIIARKYKLEKYNFNFPLDNLYNMIKELMTIKNDSFNNIFELTLSLISFLNKLDNSVENSSDLLLRVLIFKNRN